MNPIGLPKKLGAASQIRNPINPTLHWFLEPVPRPHNQRDRKGKDNQQPNPTQGQNIHSE